MSALSTWVPEDALLGMVAPLALAASRRTALVVDLDPNGGLSAGEVTLADLVARGPTRQELQPDRSGTGVLPNGGIELDDAGEVLAALVAGWPHVVFRQPSCGSLAAIEAPVVPIRLLRPGTAATTQEPTVWQTMGWRLRPPGPGPTLPRVPPSTVHALLEGRRPPPSRWIRALATVWGFPWT